MVSAIDLARLSTTQIHLHAITARDDRVSYRFSSTLYSTDSLTRYNNQRRCCQLSAQLDSLQHRFTYFLLQSEKMVSAVDLAESFTAQIIYLLAMTAREDGVSY
jgi:hypothetical protein